MTLIYSSQRGSFRFTHRVATDDVVGGWWWQSCCAVTQPMIRSAVSYVDACCEGVSSCSLPLDGEAAEAAHLSGLHTYEHSDEGIHTRAHTHSRRQTDTHTYTPLRAKQVHPPAHRRAHARANALTHERTWTHARACRQRQIGLTTNMHRNRIQKAARSRILANISKLVCTAC